MGMHASENTNQPGTGQPTSDVECSVVDVAITAYRRSTFIADAIDSVLGQDFGGWQLTIFDNGVGGGEIERATAPYLSDSRVSYFATEREVPLAENWTKAIRHGRLPYVALLNDDDRWHPGFLGARVQALEANPQCAFAFAEWMPIDEQGSITSVIRPPYRFPQGVVPREELARWFTHHNIVVPPSIVVRRAAYDEVGASFDPRWHYCDWEMWARLAASFPAYYLERRDSDYRRHAQVNTFATSEEPERLVAMVDHLEQLFAMALPGFSVGRLERRQHRSHVLLHAAGDVHQGGGWAQSWPLHRRALREYPPALFDRISMMILGRTLVGRRGRRAIRRALTAVRLGPRRDGITERRT